MLVPVRASKDRREAGFVQCPYILKEIGVLYCKNVCSYYHPIKRTVEGVIVCHYDLKRVKG